MGIQILNSLQEHYTFLYAENTIDAKIVIAMMIFSFVKKKTECLFILGKFQFIFLRSVSNLDSHDEGNYRNKVGP